MSTKLTLDEVKVRIKELFEDSFEFPNIDDEYQSTKSKITLICPIHGSIQKVVSNMLSNQGGYSYCSYIKRGLSAYFYKTYTHKEMNDFYAFIKRENLTDADLFSDAKKVRRICIRYNSSLMNECKPVEIQQ